MTSENQYSEAYMWIWLPNETEPVVAGKLKTAHTFLLSEQDVRDIFEKQKSVIEEKWNSVCDEAKLNEVDRKLLWGRQFLNTFSTVTD